MKLNRIPKLLIFLIFIFLITGCSSAKNTTSQAEDAEETVIVLTLEELKEYNGKDDKPAYIAVDGIIYDVSSSSRWKNGTHNGYNAGNDLSKEIEKVSPHGKRVLNKMPVVGKIAED